MSKSPKKTNSIGNVGHVNYPQLKFDHDEMGNVIVMVEDHEGNLISESFDGFNDLSQDVQDKLKNDNFDSLPNETKESICRSIVNRNYQDSVFDEKKHDSPFGPIQTRSENKAMVMHYEATRTPRKKS